MNKIVRWGGIALAVLIVLVLAIPALVNANQFRPRLEDTLSKALGRPVALGDLSFSLYSGSLRASDLSIAEDPKFGNSPFMHAKSLQLGVELTPLLFSRKLNVTDLTVTEPELHLIQNAAGGWNFSSIGGKPATPAGKSDPPQTGGSAPMELSVKLITIENGRLLLEQAGGNPKPLTLEAVNVKVRDFASEAKLPLQLADKLGKGTINLEWRGRSHQSRRYLRHSRPGKPETLRGRSERYGTRVEFRSFRAALN